MVYGGMRCIKYLLFIFNFFFVVIGAILLGVGISTKAGWNKYFTFLHVSDISTPPNLLIAVGCLIFLIAFLGCCGAVKENHCMIMTYSVLVGLILVLELGAAFAAFALRDDVRDLMSKGMIDTQLRYGKENSTQITQSWDITQSTLHCCGTHNFTDWQVAGVKDIPTACCHEDLPGCAKDITYNTPFETASQTIYVDGCLEKAIKDIAVGTLGVIGLVLAGIELLGVICACFLARSIRYSYETV